MGGWLYKDSISDILDNGIKVSEWLTGIISDLGLVKPALIAIGTVVGSQKLGYWEMKSRLRHRPVPWLKAMGKTQRPPKGVGYASKIKREFYWSNTLYSRTADMTAWSHAV